MSNPNEAVALEEFRAVNAQVSFSPEQFAALQRTIHFALTISQTVEEFITTHEAFIAATEAVGEQLPGLVIPTETSTQPKHGSDFWMTIERDGVKGRIKDRGILGMIAEIREIAPGNGIVSALIIGEFVPRVKDIDCDVSLPYGRDIQHVHLDAFSTVESKAVIGGSSEQNREGRPREYKEFAAVIDYEQPEQRVKAYCTTDEPKVDGLYDALIATLPQKTS